MIKVILWDIDGTLLNFEKCERYAIRKCFETFDLGKCSDAMLEQYSRINRSYWERMERQEITKSEVLVGRFQEFFAKNQLPINKAEAFNEEYQVRLGDHYFYNDDGYELVKKCKGRFLQFAVTNGTKIAQDRKLERSGLIELLDGVYISEEVGYEKPDVRFFETVFQDLKGYSKQEILIVGDSLTSDMKGGNNAGIFCCLYDREGKKEIGNLKLDYRIQNLQEIISILT